MKFQNPKATLLQECSSQSSQRTATLQRPNRPSQPPPPPPKATLHIDPKGSNFYEVPTRLASQTTATDQEDRISWKFDDFDSGNKPSMKLIWSFDSDILLSKWPIFSLQNLSGRKSRKSFFGDLNPQNPWSPQIWRTCTYHISNILILLKITLQNDWNIVLHRISHCKVARRN